MYNDIREQLFESVFMLSQVLSIFLCTMYNDIREQLFEKCFMYTFSDDEKLGFISNGVQISNTVHN